MDDRAESIDTAAARRGADGAVVVVVGSPAMGTEMRAYELWPDTGLAVLRPVARPVPTLGEGEVLVRVTARSINFTDLTRVRSFDLAAKTGHRGPAQPVTGGGLIPLSDNAGEVVAVGPDVTLFTAGDRVVANHFQDWHAGAVTRQNEVPQSVPGMPRPRIDPTYSSRYGPSIQVFCDEPVGPIRPQQTHRCTDRRLDTET